MKAIKKILTLFAIVVMLLISVTSISAQTEGTAADNTGSITINNASKGETYKVYKLFNATVGTGGAISYTGDIPSELSNFFTKDSAGNISKAEGKNDSEIVNAVQNYVSQLTASPTVQATSDGSVLVFQGLSYGYYAVTSTQGTIVSVDSTNPNVVIYDKNNKNTSLDKTVNNTEFNIGDTVTYTVKYQTMNFEGADSTAKRVVSYTITDTLPDFLSDVQVTSILIDQDKDGNPSTGTDIQVNVTKQFTNKAITLEWVDSTNNSKYVNGSFVIVTYTAKFTDKASIDGEGNTNKVTLTYKVEGDDTDHGKKEDIEKIYTYALAFKKVDDKGAPLSGAVFQLPFYVKSTADEDGAYIYAGISSGDGLTNLLTTPTSGEITIKGMKQGVYSFSEKTPPNGYGKLTSPFTVEAKKTGHTTTAKITKYLDADGNVTSTETDIKVEYENSNIAVYEFAAVVNKKTSALPSTGGIGTTVFHVTGACLAIGAAVLLISKKRMNNN